MILHPIYGAAFRKDDSIVPISDEDELTWCRRLMSSRLLFSDGYPHPLHDHPTKPNHVIYTSPRLSFRIQQICITLIHYILIYKYKRFLTLKRTCTTGLHLAQGPMELTDHTLLALLISVVPATPDTPETAATTDAAATPEVVVAVTVPVAVATAPEADVVPVPVPVPGELEPPLAFTGVTVSWTTFSTTSLPLIPPAIAPAIIKRRRIPSRIDHYEMIS